MPDARPLLELLGARGLSLATAESLTGGLLSATVVSVPGASRTFRGGVVAYSYAVKSALLGVPPELLAARGAVDPEVAERMAQGARVACGADVGLSTTGVAGPDPADGEAVGTVYVAAAAPGRCEVRRLSLDGDRDAVRAGAVQGVLDLAEEVLRAGGRRGKGESSPS